MRRLFKYLRPYLLFILAAVSLLFIQALTDLALPDYLSRIVNTGLQQSGVESPVPQALRPETMDKLFLFLDDDDQDTVLGAYSLIKPGSADWENYLEEYPAVTDEGIYVLQEIDQSLLDDLNDLMGGAFVGVSGIQRMVDDPTAALALGEEFDPSQIPAGMDVFQALALMPEELRLEMAARMEEIQDAMGENMIDQMAVAAVKEEYQELGLDVGQLQQNYILNIGLIMLLISLLGGTARQHLERHRRRQVQQAVERAARLFGGEPLQRLAQGKQHHDDRRLGPFTDERRADDRDHHQRVDAQAPGSPHFLEGVPAHRVPPHQDRRGEQGHPAPGRRADHSERQPQQRQQPGDAGQRGLGLRKEKTEKPQDGPIVPLALSDQRVARSFHRRVDLLLRRIGVVKPNHQRASRVIHLAVADPLHLAHGRLDPLGTINAGQPCHRIRFR